MTNRNECDPARTELFLYNVKGKYQHLFELAFRHEAFQHAETFREQVGVICELLYGNYEGITYEVIGSFFNVSKSTIHTQNKKYKSIVKMNGRPAILSFSDFDQIRNFIEYKYQQSDPTSFDEISNFIFYQLHKSLLPDTLRSNINSMQGIKTVKGCPIELDRLLCDPCAIDKYFEDVANVIDDIPGAFMLNIDESGYQPYSDAIKHKCIVPDTCEDDKVYFGVDRGAKKCTMLAGIFGDGTTLKPFIIIERKTIEMELLLEGYSPRKYHFVYQEKAYITMQSFHLWAKDILFPEIQRRRRKYNYQGPCLLIMDGCTSHESPSFRDDCLLQNIIIIFIAPHSSDQCQMLDLVIFGLQKRFMKKIFGDNYLSKQTKQLIRILSSWRAATTPENVIAAWKSAGYEPYIKNNMIYYKINLAYARAVRHIMNEEQPVPQNIKKRINIGRNK